MFPQNCDHQYSRILNVYKEDPCLSLTCHCSGWWTSPIYWSRILIGTSPRSFQTFESFWLNSHRCHVDKALAWMGHGCIQNTRTVFRIWRWASWKTYTKYPTIVKYLNTHDDMFEYIDLHRQLDTYIISRRFVHFSHPCIFRKMSFKKEGDVFPMSMGGQLLTASRWGSCALLGPSPWRPRRSRGSWAQAVPVVMRPVAHVAGATKRSGPRRRMSFSDGRTWFLVILEDCDNDGDKDSDDKNDISFVNR